eukprot:6058169-Karenia_brevis.AAC.1
MGVQLRENVLPLPDVPVVCSAARPLSSGGPAEAARPEVEQAPVRSADTCLTMVDGDADDDDDDDDDDDNDDD